MIKMPDNFIASLASLVFPHYCPECTAEMPSGDGWACASCWRRLGRAGKGHWSGRTLNQNRVFVAFHYGDLARQLVHQMKFYGRRDVAVRLGGYAAEHLLLGGVAWPVTAIVPVPLHPVRIRERGYDQNLMLARGVAKATGLPVRTDLVRRIRHTRAQSKLSDKERLVNLKGAFEPKSAPKETIPSSILLVDDVIHTGATICGCIEAIEKHGQIEIGVLAACG